jgi:hypothetical protein
VLDVDRRRGLRAQQVAQRGDGALRTREAFFQAVQVGGYEVVARCQVGSGQDGGDHVQRHVQIPEPADDLRGRDLVRRVEAVPGLWVHLGGLEKADLVVVTQRLVAQVRRSGKVTDR